MAKKSSIEKNNRRKRIVARDQVKRAALKKIIMSKSVDLGARFEASMKLAKLPRDGSPCRVVNRCELTGRPRGVYSKFKLSRICLRELASKGCLPGVTKSSW